MCWCILRLRSLDGGGEEGMVGGLGGGGFYSVEGGSIFGWCRWGGGVVLGVDVWVDGCY